MLSDSRVTISRETVCPSRPGIKALQQKSSLLTECPWARLYILIHFRDIALVTLFQISRSKGKGQVTGEMYLFLQQRLEWGWLIWDSHIYPRQVIYKRCRQETKFSQCVTKIVYSVVSQLSLSPSWHLSTKRPTIHMAARPWSHLHNRVSQKLNTNWLNSINLSFKKKYLEL